jgi:hypothetical protein
VTMPFCMLLRRVIPVTVDIMVKVFHRDRVVYVSVMPCSEFIDWWERIRESSRGAIVVIAVKI